jgi:hypothetical protein
MIVAELNYSPNEKRGDTNIIDNQKEELNDIALKARVELLSCQKRTFAGRSLWPSVVSNTIASRKNLKKKNDFLLCFLSWKLGTKRSSEGRTKEAHSRILNGI